MLSSMFLSEAQRTAVIDLVYPAGTVYETTKGEKEFTTMEWYHTKWRFLYSQSIGGRDETFKYERIA
jgi:hypothetical protein